MIRRVILPLLFAFAACNVFAIAAQAQSEESDWPAGVAPREELSDERSYDYNFTGISVRTLQIWLGRIGIEIPVDLDGELSGWIWAQRSDKSWFNFSEYRIEGEIRSADLGIDQWRVADASVRFGFADGNWYVGKIAGELRSPEAQSLVGIVSADAKILTVAKSEIELNAKIDSVQLGPLFRSLGIDVAINNAGGSVSFEGTVPISSVSNPAKWRVSAKLELTDVALPWVETPGNAFASVKLADGTWNLSEGRIGVGEQLLSVAGKGKLDAELPFELSAAGRDIDISQLVRQLKNYDLAEHVAGTVRMDAKVVGNGSTGIQRATAAFLSEQLVVKTQQIKQLDLQGTYPPEAISLDIASAELAGGSVKGSAKWLDVTRLIRGIPASANLEIQQLLLEELGWIQIPVSIRGRATGDFEFETKTRDDLDDWSSQGRLKIDGLETAGTKMGEANLEWNKTQTANQLNGKLAVRQGQGSLRSNIKINLVDESGATIRATQFRDYRADGQLENYDLKVQYGGTGSDSIPIRAVGSFDVSGSLDNWLEQGKASLSSSIAMVGDQLLRLELADVSFNKNEFRIQRFRLLDQNGRVAGAASIRRDGTGEHRLRLRVVDFELGPFVDRVAPKQLETLKGMATVELELTKAAVAEEILEGWRGSLQGRLVDLNFQGQSVGELEFVGRIADRTLSTSIKGQLLGGVSVASLSLPLSFLQKKSQANPELSNLQIQVTRFQARRLAGIFFDRRFANRITGVSSIKLTAEGASLENIVARLRLDVPAVMLNRMMLTRDLTVQLRYADNNVFVERLAGEFTQGRIEIKGQLKFDEAEFAKLRSSRINFLAQSLDIHSLVGLFSPGYASYYAGKASYRGTAIYHQGVQLNGSLSIKNGMLFGIPIQNAKGDLTTQFGINGGFQKIVSRDLRGTGVGGKFDAKLLIQKQNQFTLNTSGKLTRGKLDQISQAFGFQQIVGSGTFDSSFNLQSRQIDSLNALTGSVQVDFEDGDVKSIPILSSVDRFVPLVQFASTKIENGRMNARIGQGQLRIIDLTLFSDAFWLAADGRVALGGSSLDINAVLQTGGGVQQSVAQSLFQQSLLGVAPQVAAINQLNEMIRNRSIFLHVGGTTSIPVVQAKSGQTAAKAFLQNLSRNALAIPITNE